MASFWVLDASAAYADLGFLKNRTILGCENEEGYPPFIYENKQSGSLEGYSVDILDRVFEDSGAKIEYQLLPWKRCILKMGAGSDMDIVLAAASTEERRDAYLFSDAIAAVNLAYFYDGQRFPDGPLVRSREDLEKLMICGMRGFVYHHYDISKEVIQSAGSFQQMADMVIAERCDVALIRHEVFKSLALVDSDLQYFTRLKAAIIPWREKEPIEFYFLARKNSDFHAKLIDFINYRIRELEASGELLDIKKRHGFLK